MRLTSALLAHATAGVWRGVPPAFVPGVAIDSRRFPDGYAFLALKGERFDGHAFAKEVALRASLLIGEEARAAKAGWQMLSTPQLLVRDTHETLCEIAKAARGVLTGLVVVITGSVGKTTTKEMLAHILRELGFFVHANYANENNLIGLPLSLLATPEGAEVIVLEAGTNRPGEIAKLAAIARPDLAAITAIAPAHLAGLKDEEGVAREKGALFAALAPGGEAWCGPGVRAQLARAGVPVDAADEVGGFVTLDWQRDCACFAIRQEQACWQMPLPVRAWAEDAAMAIALALRIGERLKKKIPLAACVPALARWRPLAGRLCPHFTRSGLCVIDDSYNANPRSMAVALDLLRAMPAPRLAVLGEMAELGAQAPQAHAEVDLSGIDHVALIGDGWRAHPSRCAVRFASLDDAEPWLRAHARKAKTALVKGSRSAAMERAAMVLIEEAGGDAV